MQFLVALLTAILGAVLISANPVDPTGFGLTLRAEETVFNSSINLGGKKLPPICGPRIGDYCLNENIRKGQQHLHDVTYKFHRTCDVGAGPGKCSRVSCGGSAGIYLCNDNPYPISPQGDYIGTYAQNIMDSCSITVGKSLFSVGQVFDTDGYNVIVKYGGEGKDGC